MQQEAHKKDEQINEQINEHLIDQIIEQRLAAIGGDRAAIERRLAALGGYGRIERLLDLFAEGKLLSASEISEELELKATRTREILAELVKMGFLVKHGNGRYTRYSFKD